MTFTYTELPNGAGGWPRPLLDLEVAGMADIVVPCLVDSGSLHTLLPRWVAEAAGVDVERAPRSVLSVGAANVDAATVTVALSGAGHTWEAEVCFCDPWPYGWGLLGQKSFFRFFTVVFRAADFEFDLDPVAA